MLTFSVLTVPRGGQCTCSHLPSTKKLIALYSCNPPRALHMALLTPHELQVPPYCLLGHKTKITLTFFYPPGVFISNILLGCLSRWKIISNGLNFSVKLCSRIIYISAVMKLHKFCVHKVCVQEDGIVKNERFTAWNGVYEGLHVVTQH